MRSLVNKYSDQESFNLGLEVQKQCIEDLTKLRKIKEKLFACYLTRKSVDSFNMARLLRIEFYSALNDFINATYHFIRRKKDAYWVKGHRTEKNEEGETVKESKEGIIERLRNPKTKFIKVSEFWKDVKWLLDVFDRYLVILNNLRLWDLVYKRKVNKHNFME